MKHVPLVAAAALAAVVAAGAVSAQIADGGLSKEQATVLAGACFNCHGTDGNSPGPIPGLAGLPAETIITLMVGFKQDAIPGTTIMGRIAKGYSDAEIEAVARYFAGYWN